MIAVLVAIKMVAAAIYFIFFCPDPLVHIPGPRRVPVFGSSLHLDLGCPHLSLENMAGRYGPIFKLDFQGNPSVFVCDFASIYQVLVSKSGDFAGRPSLFLADVLTEGQSGIAFTNDGQQLKGRRKLVHQYLEQYGAGIQRIEEITTDATNSMMQELLKLNGGAVDISDRLLHCVVDIVSIMLLGDRVSAQTADEALKVFREVVRAFGETLGSELVNAFPIMRCLPNPAYKDIMTAVGLKNSLILKWIESKPLNGLVSYINEMTAAEKEKYQVSELKQQVTTVFDIFSAGMLTTTSTLSMLINVLCHNPRVQEKLREEIKDVIGDSRLPTLADRDEMHYHMATLLEISRYASIVPLSLSHKTTRDASLDSNGATIPIPAGTQIIPHLWSMHHDEKFWITLNQLDPDRILDSVGHLVAADHPNRKHLMPFSAGHRVCIGEVFAMTRMFLILAHIIQTFQILPESSLDAQPSCDPRHMKYGLVIVPNQFKVRLVQW